MRIIIACVTGTGEAVIIRLAPFIAPTALVGTLRAPQKPSRSQLLRGILVDHDVLYGGEALLDGIVGALGYRVGIHQS